MFVVFLTMHILIHFDLLSVRLSSNSVILWLNIVLRFVKKKSTTSIPLNKFNNQVYIFKVYQNIQCFVNRQLTIIISLKWSSFFVSGSIWFFFEYSECKVEKKNGTRIHVHVYKSIRGISLACTCLLNILILFHIS